MSMRIKCNCGRDDLISDDESELLNWDEDGDLKCACGRVIPFKGHQKPKGGSQYVYWEE